MTDREGKKRHNWVTGPNNWSIDRKTDAEARVAIESCGHLTPATEAAMENCLGFVSRSLTRAEVIARNEPGFEPPEPTFIASPLPSDDAEPVNEWMETEPTQAELAEIEAEAVEVSD